jgi:DNA-binding MarR family transcriptional regulator
MISQQFYPIKLEDARGLYERGLLSTSGFLYLFLKIRLAPGWKITLQQREISQQLGISRSQFYRAIHKLSDEGLIDWEAPNGLVVTVKVSSDERNSATPNGTQLCRTELSYAERNSVTPSETPVAPSETPVAPSETKTPVKPSSVKASSDSSDSYQIFFKSLSDKAREKFFNFVREKISEFSKPIHDVQGWLAGKNQAGIERFRVYYEMFQKEIGEVFAPSQDWANHPKYQEWLSALSRYPKGFPYMDDFPGSRDEKKAFAEWALGNSLA